MAMRLLRPLLIFALLALPARADFSNWAAVVVAGDWHAHSGAPSKVFDNARQTISQELVGIGFKPQNVAQFSVRPDRDPAHAAQSATPKAIADGLDRLAARAGQGCLVYFTSHGSPDGIVLGNGELSPRRMARMVDAACARRPAVIVVAACYSGVFVPALRGPDRIVITAAAADRPSFGCGEADQYTFFDNCAVAWLPKAGDFESFARDAIGCVHKREKAEKVDVASHPQLAIGPHAANAFPKWR
ncbi:MAG: peptidase C13 [Alphaproteobacteria bacterium]|nr:peptidase C13 [Alphaproteobacteria bacterium]MDE2631397.1 peptidase C13 [Alphaproteobacteria bacterium]